MVGGVFVVIVEMNQCVFVCVFVCVGTCAHVCVSVSKWQLGISLAFPAPPWSLLTAPCQPHPLLGRGRGPLHFQFRCQKEKISGAAAFIPDAVVTQPSDWPLLLLLQLQQAGPAWEHSCHPVVGQVYCRRIGPS